MHDDVRTVRRYRAEVVHPSGRETCPRVRQQRCHPTLACGLWRFSRFCSLSSPAPSRAAGEKG
jgi:hypothetical protein